MMTFTSFAMESFKLMGCGDFENGTPTTTLSEARYIENALILVL
jgi:hypothetical protein